MYTLYYIRTYMFRDLSSIFMEVQMGEGEGDGEWG